MISQVCRSTLVQVNHTHLRAVDPIGVDPFLSPVSAPIHLPSPHGSSPSGSEPTLASAGSSHSHAPPLLSSSLQPSEDSETAGAALRTASEHIWAGRTRAQAATVEDDPDETEDEDAEQAQGGGVDDEYEYEHEWGTENYDSDKFTAISVWDELSELFQHKGQISGAYTGNCGR